MDGRLKISGFYSGQIKVHFSFSLRKRIYLLSQFAIFIIFDESGKTFLIFSGCDTGHETKKFFVEIFQVFQYLLLYFPYSWVYMLWFYILTKFHSFEFNFDCVPSP